MRRARRWKGLGPLGLLVGALIACGPSTAPTTSMGGGTAGDSTTVDPTATGPATTGSQTTTIDPSDSTTSPGLDSSGSSGVVDTCSPRDLPEPGPAISVLVDGRVAYPPPESATCVLEQVDPMPAEPGTTELDLQCTIDGMPAAMTLVLPFELVEPLAVGAGTMLGWERVTEVCCGDWETHTMVLRDESGTMVLGAFRGFEPEFSPGAMTLLEPYAMEIVTGVCEQPCEFLGCGTRAALDVSVGGDPPVRIVDGQHALVSEPAHRVYAVLVMEGIGGIGTPNTSAEVVIARVP